MNKYIVKLLRSPVGDPCSFLNTSVFTKFQSEPLSWGV